MKDKSPYHIQLSTQVTYTISGRTAEAKHGKNQSLKRRGQLLL